MARVHDFDIPDHVLKSLTMQREVDELAERIADGARSQGVRVEGEPGDRELPVEVSSYTSNSGRARATVWLAHPAGAAVQAKHGTLTKAAAQAGLRVKD